MATRNRATFRRRLFSVSLCLCGLIHLAAQAAPAADQSQTDSTQKSQELFIKAFGNAARLDPAMVARVKAAKPGERIFLDTNGDGKNDECWFIDTDPRNTKDVQPLLVRAIDRNGNMDAYKGPDLADDLYIADYHADGTVDAIIEYTDTDHDGDVDEMGMYFYMPHHPFFGDDVLRVWWGRDDGDDNLLWWDVNYQHHQDLCQYRCHFSGDESFVAFGLHADSTTWASAFENPFLFYDPDHDGCSEVVLRIEGQADRVRAIRYSFDADDDAFGDRTHDYDFSITAVTEQDKPLQIPSDLLVRTNLRGMQTQGWLDRDRAQSFVARAPWSKALLTWDEMNANTEENVSRDPHERWEGVIAHGSDRFPQVGGPPCSTLNKRNELMLNVQARKPDPRGMRLYYDTYDRKMHLVGAGEGWLDVDYNMDGKVDAQYSWQDEDGDGKFDRRRIDIDADGKVDFDWPMNGSRDQEVDLDWSQLMPFYKYSLPKILEDSQAFLDAARSILPELNTDPVAKFFVEDLPKWMPQTQLGAYMRQSPAGARFYADLIRDRAFAALHAKYNTAASWSRLEHAYSRGRYEAAAQLVGQLAAASQPVIADAYGAFTKRVEVRIENTGGLPRVNWPVSIRVADIHKHAADFNADNCAVVAGDRWIQWRQIPHQVDEIDSSTGPELSFLADLPGTGEAAYFVYYAPDGKSVNESPRRTGTAEDWVPPNIGWESTRCAYRAYWGQFDFFGKKTDELVYDTIGAKGYHSEVDWGIDALHVGSASGLGGLTLYVGDNAYLVQNPAGKGDVKFTKKQLVKGPIRAAVEIAASNIVPEHPDLSVKMLCIIYAEQRESEIRASVTGAQGESVLAPGLVKLDRQDVFDDTAGGSFGTWGYQQEVIGDIGMAVIAPPSSVVKIVDLPDERRMQCRTSSDGRLRYWIWGDWRRGRQHPVAPTISNWSKEVKARAALLNQPPKVTFGEVRTIQKQAAK